MDTSNKCIYRSKKNFPKNCKEKECVCKNKSRCEYENEENKIYDFLAGKVVRY